MIKIVKRKKMWFSLFVLLLIIVGVKILSYQDYYKIRSFRTNADIFGYDLITRNDSSWVPDRYFIHPDSSPEGVMFLMKKFIKGGHYTLATKYLESAGARCLPPKHKEGLVHCYYDSTIISSLMRFDLWAAFIFWHKFHVYIEFDQKNQMKSFTVSRYQDHF